MTTRTNVRSRLTTRLRAMTGRSARRRQREGECTCNVEVWNHIVQHRVGCPLARSRVGSAQFTRAGEEVWLPEAPSLAWFRRQGSEPMPMPEAYRQRRWWQR